MDVSQFVAQFLYTLSSLSLTKRCHFFFWCTSLYSHCTDNPTPIFHSDSIIKKKLQIVWEAFTYGQLVEVLGHDTPKKDMLTTAFLLTTPETSRGNKIFQEFSYSREDSILTILSPDRFRLFASRTSISSSIRVWLHLNLITFIP